MSSALTGLMDPSPALWTLTSPSLNPHIPLTSQSWTSGRVFSERKLASMLVLSRREYEVSRGRVVRSYYAQCVVPGCHCASFSAKVSEMKGFCTRAKLAPSRNTVLRNYASAGLQPQHGARSASLQASQHDELSQRIRRALGLTNIAQFEQ